MTNIKNKKQIIKELDKMFDLFTNAQLYFYIWKYLQEEAYNKHFKENNFFWSATLNSLHYSFLTALSKLYESSNYSKKIKCFQSFL